MPVVGIIAVSALLVKECNPTMVMRVNAEHNMELKHIEVPFEVKSLHEDDEFFHIEGFANTFDIDLGDDRTVRGSFLESIAELEAKAQPAVDRQGNPTKFKALMPALWQHDSRTPVGVHVELREEDGGLFSHSIYPKEDTFVSGRIMPQVRVGSVRKQSIGYIPRKVSFEDIDGSQIRNLEIISLMEASLVTFPMNTGASITDFKVATSFQNLPLADRTRPWDSGQALSRVRDFTGSEDAPASDYKRAFFWWDEAAGELFGSYKLPFVDVIDGRLVAVPRGIFAAAAAMAGARGGVEIPDQDRPGVISHINRYYEKMDLESPFERDGKCFRLDDFAAVNDPAVLEKLFRDGVKLSRSRAKELSSIVVAACGQKSDDEGQRDADEKIADALDKLLTKIKR